MAEKFKNKLIKIAQKAQKNKFVRKFREKNWIKNLKNGAKKLKNN